MTTAAAAPPVKRGDLIFALTDSDVFYFSGHLTWKEARGRAEVESIIGFIAVLAHHRHTRVFRPVLEGFDWAQGHGWREAVIPEELARTDLVDATRIWVREAWMSGGRRRVIYP